ncbi:MAG: aminotransferase class III-fold pyridoxal phosphate-dependent enzyme, partial [Pseudomonadota bacterium]
GKSGVIATNHTYHGNTTAVAALSTTNAPPGQSTSRVRHVAAPDSYRPPALNHAQAFAEDVARAIHELEQAGCGFSALIVCPFFANEGFPALEPGFLDPALEIVRAAGGLLICDEVQCGFGRIGSHMWGHERMKCAPDIVTLGKPMANGHPVGGVVTTQEYMTAFRFSYRYFNTFGGNPVSCAAALATLDVLEREDLAANADRVGAYARDGLARLAGDHHCIGDVRGSGLFFGAEMVLDRETRAPAREFVNRVTNAMRQRGVLLNRLGIHYNTLKIRPPMPFSTEHADILLATLDDVLRETALVG